MRENGIYKIVNTINGKIYIGSTFCSGGFKRRWTVHKSGLNTGKHPNRHLQSAWNKYGKNVFLFVVVEEIINSDILLEREQWYMDFYDSYNDKKGYNISKHSSAPMLNRKHSDESKKKIGKASKGNKYSLGRKASDETRKLMSIAKRNESKETRKKRSNSLMGNKNSLGVVSINIRPIYQLDLENNIIKLWVSITSAGNKLELQIPNIIKVCKGERNTCGGFKWKYKN